MSLDMRVVIEVVLTLAATGTLMWLVRKYTLESGFAFWLASLAGTALLLVLFVLDVASAVYILATLIVLIVLAAAAFLLGVLGEM